MPIINMARTRYHETYFITGILISFTSFLTENDTASNEKI
jgi:hypothetical protein